MLQDASAMRLETNIDTFQKLFHDFVSKYDGTSQIRYFLTNYGPEGVICPQKKWARCYNLGAICHNLYIERYHATIKNWGLRPNLPMDQTILVIGNINDKFNRKNLRLLSGLLNKQSTMQEKFSTCHKSIASYSIEINDNAFKIYNINDCNKFYYIRKNSFSLCMENKCQVKCIKCPSHYPCVHKYTCNCPQYAFKNVCKHLHMISAYLCKPRPPPGYDHDYVSIKSTQDQDDIAENHMEDNDTQENRDDNTENHMEDNDSQENRDDNTENHMEDNDTQENRDDHAENRMDNVDEAGAESEECVMYKE